MAKKKKRKTRSAVRSRPTNRVDHKQRAEAGSPDWVLSRLQARAPAVGASIAFVAAGLIYDFWWGAHPWWNTPGDVWLTFQAASQIAHGHPSLLYETQYHFVTFPGIAYLLTPIAALASGAGMSVDILPSITLVHPQAWVLLGPTVLLLSAVSLFAFDAVAERIGASRSRRIVLAFGEAVSLWSVTVFFGHPEDVLAVALITYGYLLSFEKRWNGAAWLFGLGVAFQPLVLATLPILLALMGLKRWARFLLRAVVPGLVVILGPLAANYHATLTALTQQPNFPRVNHQTPWTALAPRLHLGVWAVAAGPGRAVALILACVVGVLSIRWRDNPDMLIWGAALALSLRCFTESVMDTYYLWPALALALVASTRTQGWRFATAMGGAVTVMILAQFDWAWATWWTVTSLGLVVVLACACPHPLSRIIHPTDVSLGEGSRTSDGTERPNATPAAAGGSKSSRR